MAGFEVTIIGRFWVTAKVSTVDCETVPTERSIAPVHQVDYVIGRYAFHGAVGINDISMLPSGRSGTQHSRSVVVDLCDG